MNDKNTSRLGLYCVGYMVLSASVVGYFVGIQSPMRKTTAGSLPEPSTTTEDDGVMLATSYSEIGVALRSYRAGASTAVFEKETYPSEEIAPSTIDEKQEALARREHNRAFNGAPPTIPHPIDQMTSESCLACHGEGVQTKTLRVAKMSHKYYANCTQCHVESTPQHAAPFLFARNTFAGLPAPLEGPRAYSGAPPQIPHTTWMREDCLSCHGFASKPGIQTTHPWRQACLQCHTSSSERDQILLPEKPRFLVSPEIIE